MFHEVDDIIEGFSREKANQIYNDLRLPVYKAFLDKNKEIFGSDIPIYTGTLIYEIFDRSTFLFDFTGKSLELANNSYSLDEAMESMHRDLRSVYDYLFSISMLGDSDVYLESGVICYHFLKSQAEISRKMIDEKFLMRTMLDLGKGKRVLEQILKS